MKITWNLHTISLLAVITAALAASAALAVDASSHRDFGIIKSVDAAAHTLVVSNHRKTSEPTFLWNDQTKFIEHGKAATAADLRPGERVRIAYSGTADSLIVETLHIGMVRDEKSVPKNLELEPIAAGPWPWSVLRPHFSQKPRLVLYESIFPYP